MDNKIVIAMKAVVVHNNKVLIIKRSKTHEFSPGTWEFVGGKLEFGEDLEEGLKREILEETGLTVTIEKMLYATSFKTHHYRQVVILCYLCHTEEKNIILSNEHEEYLWAGKETMKKLLPKNMLKNLKKNHVLDLLNIDE